MNFHEYCTSSLINLAYTANPDLENGTYLGKVIYTPNHTALADDSSSQTSTSTFTISIQL